MSIPIDHYWAASDFAEVRGYAVGCKWGSAKPHIFKLKGIDFLDTIRWEIFR